ncbi:MAG: 4-alpha-glucanotransferase [Vicinamibacterales bacterium]
MSSSNGRRRAGLLIPLFSCASTASWGIGDIGDLEPVTAWLAGAGQRILQLLPLNEMATGQQSPYSAISAMAIDPIYISVPQVAEFTALGGEAALPASDLEALAAVRASPRIDYRDVRSLKRRALRSAFERFLEREWRGGSERGRAFQSYVSEQAWWLEDYSLFRALHARERDRPWMEWPEALQRRHPLAIDRARRELADEVLFQQYLQWLAGSQWQAARRRTHGVALFGDLPFMVDTDSADVWVRQHQFRLDMSVGAPPDAFSATGQDWGMPVYQWGALAAEDYRWLRERARRSADLFDGYRVDHLVGFYRTYGRLRNGGDGFFTPSDEAAQRALGETVLELFRGAGAEIIAEDLGTVPDFVRTSLARLGIPGFRVFRWERKWHDEGQPFRDPADYPQVSVAASGTHDTEPVAVWWESAPESDRRQVSELPSVRRLRGGGDLSHEAFGPTVRDVLLEVLFASKSEMLLLPVQDAFGWRDRINEPSTVASGNWTFRLPWPVDRLDDISEARERQAQLRAWSERYGRT